MGLAASHCHGGEPIVGSIFRSFIAMAKKTAPTASPAAASSAPASAALAQGTRLETDTMGEMTGPAHVLYGASTQRAVLNFPVSGRPVPFDIVSAYGLIKTACAQVNFKLKRLDKARMQAIVDACDTQ